MKFVKGGDRKRGLCDPALRDVFYYILQIVDPKTFEIEDFNQVKIAKQFSIHENTIRNYLSKYESWGWIKRSQRFGGKGVTLHVHWSEIGSELEAAHQRYLKHKKREQKQLNERTLQQDKQRRQQHPTGDFFTKNRTRIMQHARQVFENLINHTPTARSAAIVFGSWCKQTNASSEQIIESMDLITNQVMPRFT